MAMEKVNTLNSACGEINLQDIKSNILDPLDDGISELCVIQHAGSDLGIANAARVSFCRHSESFSERDEKLLADLIACGHTSPFEHSHLMFQVRAPIFVMRQWMRHRIGVSYNEQSMRYTQSVPEFYVPKHWRLQNKNDYHHPLHEQLSNEQEMMDKYKQALEACRHCYESLLNAGIAREQARFILPVSAYSRFVFSCNLVSLFHFVQLRADSHAQWEIQRYAHCMLVLAKEYFPAAIKAWCIAHNVKLSDKE